MGQTLDNKGDGDMATWLNDYKAYKEALSHEFEGGAVAIGKVLQYQELLYYRNYGFFLKCGSLDTIRIQGSG